MVEVAGIIAGVLTSVSMIPQFVKLLKEKDSGDISPVMLIMLIIGVACWVWYGILKSDLIIILTNAFSLLLNLATLFFVLKYLHR